jgi:ribosomal protein L7/L12
MQPITDNNTPVDDTLELVIADGVQFLSSLTSHYGPEKGQEVWEAMAAAVGKEVTGRMFFKMLCGDTGTTVRFRAGYSAVSGNAVPVIKSIRQYTGLGLKEAKDLWDLSKTATSTVKVDSIESARRLRQDLRSFNCEVVL